MDSHSTLHASAFAYAGMGCLIVGQPGAGKSRLLAEMLQRGATLIADDQVVLTRDGDQLIANPVAHLYGVIELRGLGLIRHEPVANDQRLQVVISMDDVHVERLPEPETYALFGMTLPLLRMPMSLRPSAAMLILYLNAMREGRTLPPDWHPLGS
jgi:HPr kinase/phosphorylase